MINREAAFRDITDRKRMMNELQRSEERYYQLMELFSEPVVIHREGKFVYLNPAAVKTLKASKSEELIGKDLRTFIHPEDRYIRKLPADEPGEEKKANTIEQRLICMDGKQIHVEMTTFETCFLGKPAVLAIFKDITKRKWAEEKIRHLAYHDALTGLPNRYLFRDRAEVALGQARHHGHQLAVLIIDVDRFKQVNDSFGHTVGDQLVQQIARRLEQCVRIGDTIARMGGDEFKLLLPALQGEQEVLEIVDGILEAFADPFHVLKQDVFLSVSIGISIYPHHGDQIEILVQNADSALSKAKSEGESFLIYTPTMNQRSIRRLEIETHLRKALERNELEVYYQPQFNLLENRLTGVEALIRWKHPEWGMVSPGNFIPIAEETGLINPIGEWVLRTACSQVKAWHDEGYPPIRISVNLSSRQFKRNIIPTMSRILEETGLQAECLELEITESMAMDINVAIPVLQAFKDLGLRIAMDDFGTGYSSLKYIQKFPIDKIKIDQSFIRDMIKRPNNQSIISTIIVMAKHLGMTVVAEGVETEEHLLFLKEQNCEEGQGYLFCKPLPTEEMGKYLSRLSV